MYIRSFYRFIESFDTVDHNSLIDKLNLYSIKNNNLKWLSSYLSNRKQFIQAGAIKTSSLDIICGVPQGSILGSLLFIIYVNDLCNVSEISQPIIFAEKNFFILPTLNYIRFSDGLTQTRYP